MTGERESGARRGLIILDGTGTIRNVYGIAAETAFQEAVRQAVSDLHKRDGRLVSARVNGIDHVLLRTETGDGDAILVIPGEDREPLVEFITSVPFADDILNHFITSPFEAMTVVDHEARLAYVSPVHERFFGWEPGQCLGRPVTDVIENTRLHEVVRREQAEIGQILEVRGTRRIVNRFPIRNREGKLVGAIGQIMFKSPEQLHTLSNELADLKAEVDYYRRELEGLRRRASSLEDIVGDSEPMQQLKRDIERVAPLDMPILLQGESGTGKELVAGALHNLSNRSAKAMIILNSAALPTNLVESELFGYEAGAFTGANRKGQAGKFELADRSTLFLDEIGDMPPEIQAKFLRVLEDGVFQRLGGHRSRRTDFRLVSATNRDLESMIGEDNFRADLFFRIGALPLRIPPLRERLGDIPMLVRAFLARTAQRYKLRVTAVEPRAYDVLASYHWPGNVRQLFHEVQKAAIFCDSAELKADQFLHLVDSCASGTVPIAPSPQATAALRSATMSPSTAAAASSSPMAGESLKDATARLEADMIRSAMSRYQGNKKRVAEELNISRTYLYKKLEEIGLS